MPKGWTPDFGECFCMLFCGVLAIGMMRGIYTGDVKKAKPQPQVPNQARSQFLFDDEDFERGVSAVRVYEPQRRSAFSTR